ncbi:hypothetical protein C922_04878 [Plasmodium inui San Antonio 1]|uniref:Uncharacterized protein n=1 Tax=Plasmodium inui San Antonio 1 TaxID=1237626 RepID=W7A6J9_9APIC|nr:hypothetical protein C922_04878 [Plasmodium inui San Antonio 1]EUD64734.1 hypothetical protein C922_04878 [Plasmodium inui San Antonio 1]
MRTHQCEHTNANTPHRSTPTGRTFSLTSEEKKKLSWCSRLDMQPRQEDYNFESDDPPPGRKEQIKTQFKYLVPGERVKFYVTYDQQSHSTKATNVDLLD